ncbi:MAG: hypothetical protein JWN18_398 [Parcubacteria group bacterium]|nr:hypothetical protein [Parcubacteria group bacterium]
MSITSLLKRTFGPKEPTYIDWDRVTELLPDINDKWLTAYENLLKQFREYEYIDPKTMPMAFKDNMEFMLGISLSEKQTQKFIWTWLAGPKQSINRP